jgi:hypothetical protein
LAAPDHDSVAVAVDDNDGVKVNVTDHGNVKPDLEPKRGSANTLRIRGSGTTGRAFSGPK